LKFRQNFRIVPPQTKNQEGLMVRVSSLLAIATISTVGLGFAAAADLPVKARPPAVVAAPVATWTGCYVGGHAGYSWSRATDQTLPFATSNDIGPAPFGDPIVFGYDGHYHTSGFAGGIQGGCDKQFGQAVFGVVIDYSWTSQKKDSGPFQIQPFDVPTFSNFETGHVNLKNFGTARARLGFLPTPTFLVYGTGGVAWARASAGVTGTAFDGESQVPFAVSDTRNFVGWAAGIGGDWMFAPNWTFGVEYLHMDFGDANFRFNPASFVNFTTGDALGVTGVNLKLTSDIVRGTVNFRF
jgi:outer membrane immunogenic protein